MSDDKTVLIALLILGASSIYALWLILKGVKEYLVYIKANPWRVLLLPIQLIILPIRLLLAPFGLISHLFSAVDLGTVDRFGGSRQKSIVAVMGGGGSFRVHFDDGSTRSIAAGPNWTLGGYTSRTVSLISGDRTTRVYSFNSDGSSAGERTVAS